MLPQGERPDWVILHKVAPYISIGRGRHKLVLPLTLYSNICRHKRRGRAECKKPTRKTILRHCGIYSQAGSVVAVTYFSKDFASEITMMEVFNAAWEV